jgi:hypothetical protein
MKADWSIPPNSVLRSSEKSAQSFPFGCLLEGEGAENNGLNHRSLKMSQSK